jgi:hypothetical protein
VSDADKRAWVARVLGIKLPEAPATTLTAKDYAQRLQLINADAKSLGILVSITTQLRDAGDAVRAASPDAPTLLAELERRVASLAARARAASVAQQSDAAVAASRSGLVNFAKARLALQAARYTSDTARSNLQAAWTALLKTPSMQADERSHGPEVLQAVDAVGGRVPDISDVAAEVQDALDEMMNTPTAELRAQRAKAARDAIAAYRGSLTDPILTVMENSPAGSFPIHSALVTALDNLAAAIPA